MSLSMDYLSDSLEFMRFQVVRAGLIGNCCFYRVGNLSAIQDRPMHQTVVIIRPERLYTSRLLDNIGRELCAPSDTRHDLSTHVA
jgi:hypothetical protein